MKKKLTTIIFLLITIIGYAGHHFESDLAKKHPQLDLTDIFVFKSSKPGKTVFIMGFNPQSKKDSISNYAANGIYRFSIAADPDFKTGISPTFTFKNNKLQFYLVDHAEPQLGYTGKIMGEGNINRQLAFNNGINIWTGTVLDLFQGNSGGLGTFRKSAANGKFDLSSFDIGEKGNIFSQLHNTVIVLEIPNTMLPKQIFYYASTAVEVEPNHWHRVNRIAHVLFPHLYLLDNDMKIKYLNSNHQVDQDVKKAIRDNVLNYTKIANYKSNPEQYVDSLLKKIYPDILTYTIGTEAEYTVASINGRPLQADAMNVALALLVGSDQPIDDKVSIILERFQKDFPYVIPVDDAYTNANPKIEKIEVAGEDLQANETTNSAKKNYIWLIIAGVLIAVISVSIFLKKKK